MLDLANNNTAGSGQSPGDGQPPGVGAVSPDYLLDQRNPENIVNRLTTAYVHLKSQLDQTVSKYGDVLGYSGNSITMSPQLQSLLDRYNKAVEELKSLPDVEKALKDRFGSYVTVSGGSVDLAPELKKTVERLGEFSSAYDSLMHDYKAAVDDIVKRYGLKRDEKGRLVVDPDKYDQVKAELEAVNKKYGEALDRLFSQYSDLFNKRVVDGKVVYEYKPEAQAAVALQGQVAEAVKELAAAQQQALQNVLSKYGDVLSYDKTTGKVTPSKELEEKLNRYQQAVQDVNKLTSAMSTVAGMIPTFAQQLPVLKVTFQTYDRSANQFVATGGETPIYIKDEKMRKEIMDWMKQQGVDEQGRSKVKVAAFFDQNKPVVYVYNDKDEGYIINPVTGEARRAKGVSGMVSDTANAVWYKSLTDKEKKELEKWLEVQKRKWEIEQMPPVARELYAALVGAGRFAVITPAIDVLTRWVKGEDPTKGLEKFETEAAAAAEASPLAHAVGQAVGVLGVGGLAAEGLIAKGAAAGAQGVGRQFLAGLRSTLKPAAAGAVTGATFGAVEGALTGRDPLAEAAKFGALGLLTGLGGVSREQLITAGLLGGVVGASTAKQYGVEKGLEAGSAVFVLPFVASDVLSRGLGGISMETAVARRPARGPAARLEAEPVPAVEARYAGIVRNAASQVRSRMEAKPEPGLTPEDAASIASRLRFNPAEQRYFFQSLVEDAAAKIRGGGDADVVLAQLRLIRQKLDPVSRMRFDEALRQYGLVEVKTAAPEYSLREEEASALSRLFRREPEYQLTEESAKALNQFLRQMPEYRLDDAVAQQLNQFLKMPKREYALTEESAVALNQFLKTRTPEYQLTDRAALELNRFLRQRQEPEYALTDTAAQKLNLFLRRAPEYALTDEAAQRLDQFLRMEPTLTGRAVAELAETAARPKLRQVLTGKAAVELAGRPRLEPVLTSRAEVEASARARPELRPALTAKTEVQLPVRTSDAEVDRALRLPEVRNALEYALKTRVGALPEVALTPEIKQALEWAREVGRKLWELDVALRAGTLPPQYIIPEAAVPPPATKPQVETDGGAEPPDKERRPIPTLPTSQAEPPPTAKPPYEAPKTSEDEPKYNPPLLTTPIVPPMADVPPPPTYTPTVPQISEVPPLDVPTVPTYDVTPPSTYTSVPTYKTTPVNTNWVNVPPLDVPTSEAPPPKELPDVPPPTPLPPGWWRLLPPSMFAEDNKEGAYKVQTGKKQILLLA